MLNLSTTNDQTPFFYLQLEKSKLRETDLRDRISFGKVSNMFQAFSNVIFVLLQTGHLDCGFKTVIQSNCITYEWSQLRNRLECLVLLAHLVWSKTNWNGKRTPIIDQPLRKQERYVTGSDFFTFCSTIFWCRTAYSLEILSVNHNCP